MAFLVQSSTYGTMNTTDSTTMGYFVIQFVAGAYTLEEEKICDVRISTACELVAKAKYLSCTKENTKRYWEHKNQKQILNVSTCTIIHPKIFQ